jgi:steroid delta-isomerase-like uncharacterized protein
MTLENKAIVRRLYEEMWNQRKLEVLNELVSPSHALHAPNFSGSAIGPEAYKRLASEFFAGIPDLHWTIEDTIAEQDKVVVCWTFSGTHRGDYMGIPATNKKVSSEGITVHHIAGGKIMDSYGYWDVLCMMQQLGVAPALGQPKGTAAR